MSSILKALKKLEHEKAARKPDSFRIDAEILRGGSSHSFFSKGATLAAIALFLCGSGATYLFMKRQGVPEPVRPSQTSTTEVKAGSPTAVVLPPESDKSAPDPIPHLTTPLKSRSGFERAEPPKPSSRIKVPSLQLQPEKQTEGNKPRNEHAEPKPALPAAAPPAAPTPPLLKVHGIAFQDGGANGVAVVNGVAVSKGSIIEGARVEEIQKDRVRFSRGGEAFDIILDKSN